MTNIDPVLLAPEQKRMVSKTLSAILESSAFHRSKRYPALLSFIVLNTLEGNLDKLKERTVGIEVFARTADYDPSEYSVVRNAVGEVRKRLLLYFSEHPESEVRIDVPLGGYIAEFSFHPYPNSNDQSPSQALSAPNHAPVVAQYGAVVDGHKRKRNVVLLTGSILALLLVAATGVILLGLHQKNRGNDFWGPVLHNNTPVFILVGGNNSTEQLESVEAIASTAGTAGIAPANMPLGDATTAATVCGILRTNGRECKMISSQTAVLSGIRNNTVLLVGALDNAWTLRMLSKLRYQFQFDELTNFGGHKGRMIVDRNHPNESAWTIPGFETDSGVDYAIVGRFYSDVTDGTAVVAAGLSHIGTAAAGDFLSSGDGFQQIRARAPLNWNGKNFEAVLSVEFIHNNPGHIKIVALNFW